MLVPPSSGSKRGRGSLIGSKQAVLWESSYPLLSVSTRDREAPPIVLQASGDDDARLFLEAKEPYAITYVKGPG